MTQVTLIVPNSSFVKKLDKEGLKLFMIYYKSSGCNKKQLKEIFGCHQDYDETIKAIFKPNKQ